MQKTYILHGDRNLNIHNHLKAVIQRVSSANVKANGLMVGSINQGLLIFLGIAVNDTHDLVDQLLEKIIKLRIFNDDQGKMNKSLLDIKGELLIISQFTLFADLRKGNRPSFTDAGDPDLAKKLYDYFCKQADSLSLKRVQQGVFGADMKVELINDGPVTIMIDLH